MGGSATPTPEPTPPILAHYDVLLPEGTVQAVASWTNLVALQYVQEPRRLRRIWIADMPAMRWRLVHETEAEIKSISGANQIWAFVEVRPTRAGSEHVVVLLDAVAGSTRELDRSVLGPLATQAAASDRARPTALSDGGFVAWTKWIERPDGVITYELYDLAAHTSRQPELGERSQLPIVLLQPDPVTFLTRSGGLDTVVAYGSTRYRFTVIQAPYVEAVIWAFAPVAAVGDQAGGADRIVQAPLDGTAVELERSRLGDRCTDLRGSGRWVSWQCGPLTNRLEAWNVDLKRKVFVANVNSPRSFEAHHDLFFWTEERSGRLSAHVAHRTQP